jgi:hypothetical protein
MTWHLFIYYETADAVAADNARFLEEGGRTWEIDNKWSVRLDAPHHPRMSSHVHVMLRGDDVCVINRNGTPSHGTNPEAAPGWVMDRIRQKGLIEQSMLLETDSEIARFSLPIRCIQSAERGAQYRDAIDGVRLKRLREIILHWAPFSRRN